MVLSSWAIVSFLVEVSKTTLCKIINYSLELKVYKNILSYCKKNLDQAMRKTTQTHKLFAIFSVSMTYILKTFTETSND